MTQFSTRRIVRLKPQPTHCERRVMRKMISWCLQRSCYYGAEMQLKAITNYVCKLLASVCHRDITVTKRCLGIYLEFLILVRSCRQIFQAYIQMR